MKGLLGAYIPILFIGAIISCIGVQNFVLAADALRYPQCGDVHAFYYLWYGNPLHDDQWKHWDHEVLTHWTPAVNAMHPDVGKRFEPPGYLHSPYYPQLGPYSSRDEVAIRRHFDILMKAGVDVVVVSWWGRPDQKGASDTQGVSTDSILPVMFRVADSMGSRGMKIAVHLEPYPGRTVDSVREDIHYLIRTYSYHNSFAFYNDKPLFYIYDSYHISAKDWSRLLGRTGDISIRDTAMDSTVIGLLLDHSHLKDLSAGGFDGLYTYFASDGFSYGSTTSQWGAIARHCRSSGMICSLSVGPGYNDTKIRPWNKHNEKPRNDGAYYSDMWTKAIDALPQFVSITSFNEWGEGTQIEPAVAYAGGLRSAKAPYASDAVKSASTADAKAPTATKKTKDAAINKAGAANAPTEPVYYESYGVGGPDMYMSLTAKYTAKFRQAKRAYDAGSGGNSEENIAAHRDTAMGGEL